MRNRPKNPTLSIVIVSYNVREFLRSCLESVRTASRDVAVEVIIVDNDSRDGTVAALQPDFPEVHWLALNENLGFGKANNKGFSLARGRYILCLNPDTIVGEDVLRTMVQFMDAHEKVGIAGCKLLNADGTLQPACRRGFPSPWVAFTKIFGLQSLFPKSRIFGQYNQTFLDENQEARIDAISGAFMFIRREVIDRTGGFDPDFFMYGEDLDLCYRCKEAGWEVAYTPDASVVHFKGESTKRSTLNEVKVFYEAMEIFAHKHFARNTFFLLFLKAGIRLRALLAYGAKYAAIVLTAGIDIIALNVALLISSYIRFGDIFGLPEVAYPAVNIGLTAIVLLCMAFAGAYHRNMLRSLRPALAGMTLSFFLASALTYYFKQYAYSRGVLLMTIGFTIIFIGGSRLLVRVLRRILRTASERRMALITVGSEADTFVADLQAKGQLQNINLLGTILSDESHPPRTALPIIGSISRLPSLIEEQQLTEVVLLGAAARERAALLAVKEVSSRSLAEVHIVHSADELLASKVIEEVTASPPQEPEYALALVRYKVTKKVFDVLFSLIILLLIPFFVIFTKSASKMFQLTKDLLSGEKTLIGLYPAANGVELPFAEGYLGLAHGSAETLSESAISQLNEYYARHYTIGLDIEIALKAVLKTIYRLLH